VARTLVKRSTLRSCLVLTWLASASVGSADAQDGNESLASQFPWRNIGPATMMGRVSAIDAWAEDHRMVLIGSASGGVFKSTNGGVTWNSIFDDYGSQSIGDVAIFQKDPSVLWIGTGESTNRNSVGWGDGVYKSTDGGESFVNVGLRETHQIAEIAIHPEDANIVYVAALGHLWGYSGDRGLYRTRDGGATWEKLTNGLPDDGRTGATVVALHPENPEIVFVGMYERLRTPFTMNSGGPNGGLFRSTDGGDSFVELEDGLPQGETGQVDVSISLQDPNLIYAYIEASDTLPHDLSIPGPGVYRSRDGGDSWTYILRHNSRPYYHGRIRVNPADSNLVYVVARDYFHSTDGGETFERGQPWSRGGGDDHDLWISPKDAGVAYMATDQGAYRTNDGGATLLAFNNMAIGQYYAIGVDMRDPYWVYGGLQDNGGWAIPSNSRDPQGILNDHVIETNGGDGFHMQVDPTDWRTLYTTAHVGYFGRQNMETREHVFITPTPQTTVNFWDVYDPAFGEDQTNYSINGEERWLWRDIPSRTINGSILPPQFRFNWNSPLVLSPNNPHTVYIGSNYLFRSVDRGDTWRIISPDLTKNDPATRNSTNSGGLTKDVTGAENHNTIYTIDESSVDPSVIWVGTDDGNVQVTKDGGATWVNVKENIPGVPEAIWVSRVEASHFEAGRAYVTFDGHWVDDTNPYVFTTDDFGSSWRDISANLPRQTPGSTIHTIVEDSENPNLLFIGTEFGVYATIDRGESWFRFMEGLPPVAVHDLVIHPRDADLVAGTHGRSIWIADDITPLREMTSSVLQSDLHLFRARPATRWLVQSKGRIQNYFKFRGGNPPRGAPVNFYLREAPGDSVKITIEDPISGARWQAMSEGRQGINQVRWNLSFSPGAEEIEAHRSSLRTVLNEIAGELRRFRRTDLLDGMAKDLDAIQRFPNRYEDGRYPENGGSKEILVRHLELVGDRLQAASTVRDLFAVREQLLAYSQIVGDRAFLNFYPDELTMVRAQAGTYRVTVEFGRNRAEGLMSVRDDPLLNR